MPAGITTGARGAPLEVGAEPAVISAALAKPPRSLARIAPRDYTPLGQSRGGTPAGERARSGRVGASRSVRGAPRTRWCGHDQCVCRRSASLISFVARMNEVKSGSGMKARRSCPDIAPLIRATGYGPFRHRCLTSLAGGVRARDGIVLPHLSPRVGRRTSVRREQDQARPAGGYFLRMRNVRSFLSLRVSSSASPV